MSVDMYLSNSQTQAETTSALIKQQVTGYEELQKAINDFTLNAPFLTGKAYDSAKNYFSAVLYPLAQGGILLAEAVERAVKKFPEEYIAQVDSGDLKQEVLEAQIREADSLIGQAEAIRQELNSSRTPEITKVFQLTANTMLINMYTAVKEELEKKLEKLLAFHASSPALFAEIEELQNAINQGLAQTKTAWNGTSGTFAVPSDLAWKGTIQQKQEAKIEQQEKAELAGCTVLKIYDDIHKTTTYFLEKDGHRKSYDEAKLSGDLATLAAKYHLEVIELTPTEWTKRANAYQKSGKDYLSDSDEPITGLGAYATGQEVIGDMQESGVWDAMWGVGLTTAAIRNATTWQGKNVSGATIPKASDLKNSNTVQNHINDIVRKGANKGQLSRPYIDTDGTTLLLDEIMNSASPVKDSILSNGLRWDVEGVFRGSKGTWELVIDKSTNTIVHFNFVK